MNENDENTDNNGIRFDEFLRGDGQDTLTVSSTDVNTDVQTKPPKTVKTQAEIEADAIEAEKLRKEQQENNETPILNRDIQKEAAIKSGMNLNTFTTKFYDALRQYNIYNAYNKYTEKDVEKLRKGYESAKSDLKKHQGQLEGRLTYVPMITGSKEEINKRNSVSKSNKGLVYLANEERDFAKFANKKMIRSGLKASEYVAQITTLDEEIEKYSKEKTYEALARVEQLRDDRAKSYSLLETFQESEAAYARDVNRHSLAFKNYKSQIKSRRAKIENAKDAINNTEIALMILDQYVRNNSSGDTLDETIKKIHGLDEKAKKYEGVIELYQQHDVATMQSSEGYGLNKDSYNNNNSSSEMDALISKSREVNINLAKSFSKELGI